MATSRSALLVLAMAAAALVGTAMAVDHTVGASGSWDLQTNYVQWASGRTFRVGDRLVFTYSAAAHDVVEVTKANYDTCSASGPISTVQTGNDVVPLTAAGTRYFICGIPGHCTSGMKVQVNTVEAGAPAGGAPSPVSTPAARGPAAAAAPSAKTPATPSSSPASVGAGSLGVAVVAAALTMMLFN